LPNFGLKNTIFTIAKDFHGKKIAQIHQVSKEKIKIESPEGSQEYRRILFFLLSYLVFSQIWLYVFFCTLATSENP